MHAITPTDATAQDATSSRRQARTGLVIDASCDVSPDFITHPDVAVIPIPIRIGSATYVDQHDADATSRYMRENANGEGVTGQSIPLDADQMSRFFLERFALEYDSVFCLTITASRSPIHDAARHGSTLSSLMLRSPRTRERVRA